MEFIRYKLYTYTGVLISP